MKYPPTPNVEILRKMVTDAGGPAKFADQHSKDDADKQIDATYVSQILNGHRPFRDIARRNMAKRAGLPENAFEIQYSPAEQAPKSVHEPHQIDDEGNDRIDRVIRKLLTLPTNHPAIQAVEWALQSIPDTDVRPAGKTIDVEKSLAMLRASLYKNQAENENHQK
ncbi:hypothetical protein GBK02_09090 [Dechloromonas sp. TW-R-39-2]|uniref:hypothetical protein n=1 Tax=Dechloromonas sp. TW-R-39-2 TaxID=2654218 RepID=UPI00193E42AF|nr:hypothetical protein [Dechloromonas sp. TW-R-39-2]QRM19544.1 hypothetical protein GBK02_09090 [Dechloromonas sp. TW-R-39-2]